MREESASKVTDFMHFPQEVLRSLMMKDHEKHLNCWLSVDTNMN